MSNAVKKKLKFSPQSNNCTKKQAFLLNFCDRDEVKIECLKYVKHKADLPINQENQLTFLLNQFQVRDEARWKIKLEDLRKEMEEIDRKRMNSNGVELARVSEGADCKAGGGMEAGEGVIGCRRERDRGGK